MYISGDLRGSLAVLLIRSQLESPSNPVINGWHDKFQLYESQVGLFTNECTPVPWLLYQSLHIHSFLHWTSLAEYLYCFTLLTINILWLSHWIFQRWFYKGQVTIWVNMKIMPYKYLETQFTELNCIWIRYYVYHYIACKKKVLQSSKSDVFIINCVYSHAKETHIEWNPEFQSIFLNRFLFVPVKLTFQIISFYPANVQHEKPVM